MLQFQVREQRKNLAKLATDRWSFFGTDSMPLSKLSRISRPKKTLIGKPMQIRASQTQAQDRNLSPIEKGANNRQLGSNSRCQQTKLLKDPKSMQSIPKSTWHRIRAAHLLRWPQDLTWCNFLDPKIQSRALKSQSYKELPNCSSL